MSLKRLNFICLVSFVCSISCKKEVISELQNTDIKELYPLKNSNVVSRKLVKSYEIKNTSDTYYLEKSKEIGIKFSYDSKGNVIKFEHFYTENKYKYNNLGLPIFRYSSADLGFVEQEFFYDNNNLLIQVKDHFLYDKSFLRQYDFNYDADGQLSTYSMRESNAIINNFQSIQFRNNQIISTYNKSQDTITINSQNLPNKLNNSLIKYSIKDNTVTIESINNNLVERYVVIEFDNKNKPTIPLPQYLNLNPYPLNKLLLNIIEYADKNPLKISSYNRRNNTENLVLSDETIFNYKYDSDNYPTEIQRNKIIYNYLSVGSPPVKSNQIIKIEYQ
ncbi:MAG: hypothetical protein ACOVO2_18265 [Emticicia sp.]